MIIAYYHNGRPEPFWDCLSWYEPARFLAVWLIAAVILFLIARKRHGTRPTLITLAIGSAFGFLLSLICVFWPLLDHRDAVGWLMVNARAVNFFIDDSKGLVLTIGGMCASWLSLELVGPSVIGRRPAS